MTLDKIIKCHTFPESQAQADLNDDYDEDNDDDKDGNKAEDKKNTTKLIGWTLMDSEPYILVKK